MTRNAGYALLAALTALVAIISTAVFLGIDRADPGTGGELAGGRRPPAEPASVGGWVGTWSTSMVAAEPGAPRGHPVMSLRNVVHISVGGSAVRIHLSNAFGERPLTVSRATVALAAAPGSPDGAPGSMRALTFRDRRSVTVPAGGSTVSDAVRLKVPGAVDLLITTYSPTPSGGVTYHPHSRQISYAAEGDHAGDVSGAAFTEQSPYWRYLSAVDVWTTGDRGAVVALGDSITDGVRSTTGANRRWTDFLADRLLKTRGAPRLGVLNQGISGNRILVDGVGRHVTSGQSGLKRMNRDALSLSGASAVVVALGVNDILRDPGAGNPEAIIQGLRTITERAHAHGLHVVGATLAPFGGHRGFTPQREAVRQRVNAAIRSGSVFDAVVDFDRALSDPSAPDRLLPLYDSGDHLHPGDAGNQAIGDAFDLNLLRTRMPAAA